MVTLDQIKSNLQDVTSEQINRCHKVIDMQTGEDFYQVESESDDLVEYEVRYSEAHGFTCTCAAGKVGFSRITRHASGCCKHCRWAVACWLEDEAMEEQYREAEEAVANKVAKQPTVILPTVRPLNVSSIEASMPKWIMDARPEPHMRKSPREI
jgi:hypothetical protein